MIVSIEDNISTQVSYLFMKAREAMENGNIEDFFNYSNEALYFVDDWIEGIKENKQYGGMEKHEESGFNLRELNKELLEKAV